MDNFEKRWGSLTVEEAIHLNALAKQTCEWEDTCQIGEDSGSN